MNLRFLLAAFIAVLASAAQAEIRVVDGRNVTVTLPQPPRRIVSVLPSLTETVCELGECGRLVGVDRYSNFPAHVRKLPQVGGGVDPNIEAIVALRPDLVLMSVSSRGVDRLESLGLKVVALQANNSADAHRVMETIGQILEVKDVPRIWRNIEAGVSAAAQSLPPEAKNLRVYFEVNRGPYGAGESSFIGEMMIRLGLKNVLPRELGPFPKLNPEYVVRANPDIIMIGERNAQGLEQRPGWNAIRAIRDRRICIFTPEESDVLVRPGPRMAEAGRLMSRCVTGQLEASRK